MHAQHIIDELNAELRVLRSSSHNAGRAPPGLVTEGTSSELRPSSSSETVVIRQDLKYAHGLQFGTVDSFPEKTWQNSRFKEALPSSSTYHNFAEGVAAVPDNQGSFHSYYNEPGLQSENSEPSPEGVSGLASDLAMMKLRQPSMGTIKGVSSSSTIKSESSSTKTVKQSDYALKKTEKCPWHCNECYPLPPEVQAVSGRRCTMDPLGVDKASAAMGL